jgi:hypothetical protein
MSSRKPILCRNGDHVGTSVFAKTMPRYAVGDLHVRVPTFMRVPSRRSGTCAYRTHDAQNVTEAALPSIRPLVSRRRPRHSNSHRHDHDLYVCVEVAVGRGTACAAGMRSQGHYSGPCMRFTSASSEQNTMYSGERYKTHGAPISDMSFSMPPSNGTFDSNCNPASLQYVNWDLRIHWTIWIIRGYVWSYTGLHRWG